MHDLEDEPSLEELGAFLRERVESFEQLEILLLLHREQNESWTDATVAAELRLAQGLAADALDHLCRGNLLDVRVGKESLLFRYAAGTPDLMVAVDHLARAYRERRIDVLRLLSTQAVERVRTSAIRLFADAFLIGGSKTKKEGKNDG